MERVKELIAHRDKEFFSDDEINLLFLAFMAVMDGRKMENEINEIFIAIHFWTQRGAEQLVGNDRMNIEFLHDLAHLFVRRRLKVDPGQFVIIITGNHIASAFS